MHLYLAAAYSRKAEMRLIDYRISVDVPNVVVTSRWLGEETDSYYPPDPPGRAIMDVEDIDACDVIARFTDNLSAETVPSRLATGARMWETGYAYATGKRIVVVGGYQCVFDHLPGVLHLRDADALIEWLKAETSK